MSGKRKSETDWESALVLRLRELWADGLKTKDIACELGVSKNAVVGKAHRLNLPPRPSPIRRGGVVPVAIARVGRRATLPTLATVSPVARARVQPMPALPAEPPEPMRAPVPIVAPAAVAPPAPPRRVNDCCWPIGEPGRPEFRFCASRATFGRPYCEEHSARAYVRRRPAEDEVAA
jgi:GcrA cell cycle regulator